MKINLLKTSFDYKILDISGDAGDTLDNHKVDNNALLLMRTGAIIYKDEYRTISLSDGENCDIPANIFHKVICTTKASFFVVMPKKAKMKFEK